MLAVEYYQSWIILTSQYFPHQIPELCKNFWHCILLGKLTVRNKSKLRSENLVITRYTFIHWQYLQRIGAAYEAHPLALNIISGEIGAKPFNGNVVAYWKKYGCEIEEEEAEKAIKEVKT